jgi:hypothetical protein
MEHPSQASPCISGCSTPVPPQLVAERLCVLHFTLHVERNCADLHRKIVLEGASADRRAEAAAYLDQAASLLARLASNLCLSDALKARVLSTFLTLMNLRENVERAARRKSDLRSRRSAAVSTRGAAISLSN